MLRFFTPTLTQQVHGFGKRAVLLLALLALAPVAAAQNFSPRADYYAATSAGSVALGDVNGDGRLDIVTAGVGSRGLGLSGGVVSVLLGTGAGVFAAPTNNFPAGAVNITGVALGDVDGDGRLDVVTANLFANTVSVLVGTGTGAFYPKTDYLTGGNAYSVALGDVNRDGHLDIITSNSNTNTASVLLGTGTGAFGAKADFPTGAGPLDVTLGDVNGDGPPDLVTANIGAGTVSVLLGTGTGTGAFGAKSDFPTGAGPLSVTLGDVNGDGRPDLVTANVNSNTASVLLGAGTGAFGTNTDYITGGTPNSVAVSDVNGDGWLDLATGNGTSTVSVLLGTSAGTFGAKTDYPISLGAQSVAQGDVNGDGRPDLVTSNPNSWTASVLLNVTAFPAPTLANVSPASAAVSSRLLLTGTNLSSATAVRFNGATAPGFVVNAGGTILTVNVPAGASSGPLTVTTPGGTSNGLLFTVTTVTSVMRAGAGIAPPVLFPNPAHTAVTLTGADAHAVVCVFDALGRLVARATADAAGTAALVLPLGLPAGVYVVRSGARARRLMVE